MTAEACELPLAVTASILLQARRAFGRAWHDAKTASEAAKSGGSTVVPRAKQHPGVRLDYNCLACAAESG
jgi:hypothetical protein